MSKLNIEFMQESDNFFSKVEDELERKILDYLNDSDKQISDPDIAFHLSEDRNAIFRWYPLHKDSVVLEVGAGVGTISCMLAQRVKKLVCIEKKSNRCKILHHRLSMFDNVEIDNINIKDICTTTKFDYIIAHDMTGYLKKYYDDENSLLLFLKQMKTLLKEDGKILFAIENKLGLKYFAGATEDYSGKLFVGLDDFNGYDFIKTYCKDEISYWIEQAGFRKYKFFYSYPDNNFTKEIYTDDALKEIYYGSLPATNMENRFVFFNEREMFRTLQDEGVVSKFVNSYIVEISNNDMLSDISYSRIENSTVITYYNRNEERAYSNEYGGRRRQFPDGKRLDQILLIELRKIITGKVSDLENSLEYIYSIWDELYVVLRKILTESLITIGEKDTDIEKVQIKIQDIFYNGKYILTNFSLQEKRCSYDSIFWELLYEWYDHNVFQNSKLRKVIDLEKIYDRFMWDKNKVTLLRKEYRNRKNVEGESRISYGNMYKCNFLYPIDIIKNGDLVTDDFELKKEKEGSSLEEIAKEQKVIDMLRR